MPPRGEVDGRALVALFSVGRPLLRRAWDSGDVRADVDYPMSYCASRWAPGRSEHPAASRANAPQAVGRPARAGPGQSRVAGLHKALGGPPGTRSHRHTLRRVPDVAARGRQSAAIDARNRSTCLSNCGSNVDRMFSPPVPTQHPPAKIRHPATTRRRNRTFQAGGCPALPVLKTGWATRPVPRRW
jgi:hypothetical protein